MTGRSILALASVALATLGARCAGGDGDATPSRVDRSVGSVNCAVLQSRFPPGFAFVERQPGEPGELVSGDFAPPSFVIFDIDGETPLLTRPNPVLAIPPDSDGDGIPEGSGSLPLSVVLDDVIALAPGLLLATATGYEEILFVEDDLSGLRSLDVEVPAAPAFAQADNPFLPAPGTVEARTGLSTIACVRPPPAARDSRGELLSAVLSQSASCDPQQIAYYATLTSGAAIASGHLFVSTSNLGSGGGTETPQFLPGSVLVYDLSAAETRVAPNPITPVILTSGYNPTDVTRHAVAGRDFILVTVSGAIGLRADDPGTTEIEGGGLALTPSAIDVIDAQTLELVATIPLGAAALSFGRLAIDPSGRVAVTGSAAGSVLLAADLRPLAALPAHPPGGVPLVLDGSGDPSAGPDAVIADVSAPLRIPRLSGGASPLRCPGFTVSAAFNHDGSLLYASEFCDGTLAVVDVDLRPSLPQPVPRDRFSFQQLLPVVEPMRSDTLGLTRALGGIGVRPGVPGVDFTGPDLFFQAGQPGELCSLRIESLAP